MVFPVSPFLSKFFQTVFVYGACFLLILEVVRLFLKRRIVGQLLQGPAEARQIVIRMDIRIISIYKQIFWLAPIYLLVVPLSAFVFLRELFPYITGVMVIMYLGVFGDFLYRKSILRAIGD